VGRDRPAEKNAHVIRDIDADGFFSAADGRIATL
jgi:hypothetical protein